MPGRLAVAWRLALPLVALLTLPACLVYISSAPSSVGGANIIFIAHTDDGGLVAALHVSVVAVDGDWSNNGVTASDGAYRCSVGPGVKRVRAGVTLPAGYVIAAQDRWPREIDVPASGDVEIQIRVASVSSSR